MDNPLLELYSDYLLSLFGATTATGLSAVVDGAVSHDQVLFSDVQTRRGKRKSLHTQNELMRKMVRTCQHNPLPDPPAFAGVADKHFALRARLYLKAIRSAVDELQTLKTA